MLLTTRKEASQEATRQGAMPAVESFVTGTGIEYAIEGESTKRAGEATAPLSTMTVYALDEGTALKIKNRLADAKDKVDSIQASPTALTITTKGGKTEQFDILNSPALGTFPVELMRSKDGRWERGKLVDEVVNVKYATPPPEGAAPAITKPAVEPAPPAPAPVVEPAKQPPVPVPPTPTETVTIPGVVPADKIAKPAPAKKPAAPPPKEKGKKEPEPKEPKPTKEQIGSSKEVAATEARPIGPITKVSDALTALAQLANVDAHGEPLPVEAKRKFVTIRAHLLNDPKVRELVDWLSDYRRTKQTILRMGPTTQNLCCGKDFKLSKADGGRVRLAVDSHSKRYDEVVDKLLVAAGRSPNVEGLGLEAAGVTYSKKGVQVNDQLQTTQPDIYAAGDICSPYQFTHAADFMARTVIRNALFLGRAKASALTIPWCTYTEPEIAHVGLYTKQAQEQGVELDTFNRELSAVDRVILEGRTNGLVRVHVRKGSDKIAGATIVASNAGDMIAEITLAMINGLGLKQIANAIHPYPTQAEAIRQVGDAYNRTRLTPLAKSLFARWMAWRR